MHFEDPLPTAETLDAPEANLVGGDLQERRPGAVAGGRVRDARPARRIQLLLGRRSDRGDHQARASANVGTATANDFQRHRSLDTG